MIRPAKPTEVREAEEAVAQTIAPAPRARKPVQSKAEKERAAASKKRERLLELARRNARAPLPGYAKVFMASQPPPTATKVDPPPPTPEERVEEEKMKTTVRERLWKLIEGKWS